MAEHAQMLASGISEVMCDKIATTDPEIEAGELSLDFQFPLLQKCSSRGGVLCILAPTADPDVGANHGG